MQTRDLGGINYPVPASIEVLTDHELRGLIVPTLLLTGDKSEISRPDQALRRARSLTSDVGAVIIPDLGHAPPIDPKADASIRVLQFLARLSTSDAASPRWRFGRGAPTGVDGTGTLSAGERGAGVTPPEPHVRTWIRVDFDDGAAEAAITAINNSIAGLETNASDRNRSRPQDAAWGGPHYDEFVVQYSNLAGTRDDIIAELVSNRTKIQGAITAAQQERSVRQGQWNAWHAWYDRLTPEERGNRVRLQPVDKVAEVRVMRGPS